MADIQKKVKITDPTPRLVWPIIIGLIVFGGLAYLSRGCATPRETVAERTAQLDQSLEEEPVVDFNVSDYRSRCREVLGNNVTDEKCASYVGYSLAAGDTP